jgi:hypothetical protein
MMVVWWVVMATVRVVVFHGFSFQCLSSASIFRRSVVLGLTRLDRKLEWRLGVVRIG